MKSMYKTKNGDINLIGIYAVDIANNCITVQEFSTVPFPSLPFGNIYLIHGYVVKQNQSIESIEIENRKENGKDLRTVFYLNEDKKNSKINILEKDGNQIIRFDFAANNYSASTLFRFHEIKSTSKIIEDLQTGLNEIILLSFYELDDLPHS